MLIKAKNIVFLGLWALGTCIKKKINLMALLELSEEGGGISSPMCVDVDDLSEINYGKSTNNI